jgi:hypothetical protein
MNVSNDTDDANASSNEHVANGALSSSPPTTPTSTDPVDAVPLDDNPQTSSSPDRRSDIDEQPVVISPEFLPTVIQLVESLGPRRVKVYELRGEVWVDLGTGFCQGYVENVTQPLPILALRSLTRLVEHRLPEGN